MKKIHFGGDDDHVAGLTAHHREPIKFNFDGELPPLDSITVSTSSQSSNDEDDSSSCSSVSCDIRPASTRPRPIFGEYWTSQGFNTAPFYRVSPQHWATVPPSSVSFVIDLICTRQNSEEVPEEREATAQIQPSPRRSIFGMQDKCRVEWTAQRPTPATSLFRKTRSAPTLQRRSALRSSRFSGKRINEDPPDKSSIRRTVSFNDHVDVAIFPSTSSVFAECWAAEGWSDWFA